MFRLDPPVDVALAEKAEKILSGMDKHDAKIIAKTLESISENGTPQPRPLQGKLKGFHKIRIPHGRIVVKIVNNQKIIVHHIDTRDKVYKFK